jgi:hypothetical protein
MLQSCDFRHPAWPYVTALLEVKMPPIAAFWSRSDNNCAATRAEISEFAEETFVDQAYFFAVRFPIGGLSAAGSISVPCHSWVAPPAGVELSAAPVRGNW